MRLLLDANLSGPRIGLQLRGDGHDVFALAEHKDLDAPADPGVLALAAAEGRILITRNSRDFTPILREWAEAGRSHAGAILICMLQHDDFGPILAEVRRVLSERPQHSAWLDLTVAI